MYFIDANIPLYAFGSHSPLQQPCRSLLAAIASGSVPAVTSAAVLQEIVHVTIKRDRLDGGLALVDSLMRMVDVLPVEPGDIAEMARLLRLVPSLPAHDALHAAVMLRHNLTNIITADRHFAAVPGIVVLDPLAAAETLCH